MAKLYFPTLSKAPQINIQREYEDSTLRDSFDNGMEATRAAWPRIRRSWAVTFQSMPAADDALIDSFVRNDVHVGAGAFYFVLPGGEEVYVRFDKEGAPKPQEAGKFAGGAIRYNCTFKIREV